MQQMLLSLKKSYDIVKSHKYRLFRDQNEKHDYWKCLDRLSQAFSKHLKDIGYGHPILLCVTHAFNTGIWFLSFQSDNDNDKTIKNKGIQLVQLYITIVHRFLNNNELSIFFDVSNTRMREKGFPDIIRYKITDDKQDYKIALTQKQIDSLCAKMQTMTDKDSIEDLQYYKEHLIPYTE